MQPPSGSTGAVIPSDARIALAALLSKQLQRPDGVRGLFASLFGEAETGGSGKQQPASC